MPLTPQFLPPTPDFYISCLLNVSYRHLKPPSPKLHSPFPITPIPAPLLLFANPSNPVTWARNLGTIIYISFSHPLLPICLVIAQLCLQNPTRAQHLSPGFLPSLLHHLPTSLLTSYNLLSARLSKGMRVSSDQSISMVFHPTQRKNQGPHSSQKVLCALPASRPC